MIQRRQIGAKQTSPVPNTKTKTSDGWAWLSKNFCHVPLARSPGATREWRRLTWRSGHFFCPLVTNLKTGKARLGLLFPVEWEDWHPKRKRLPDRYDLDLVLHLRARVAAEHRHVIHQRAIEYGKAAIKKTQQKRKKRKLDFKDYEPLPEEPSTAKDELVRAALASGLKKTPGNLTGYMKAVEELEEKRTKHRLGQAEEIDGEKAYRAMKRKLRRSIPESGLLKFPSITHLLRAVGWATNNPQIRESVRERFEYLVGVRLLFRRSWHKKGVKGHVTRQFGFFKRVEFRDGGSVEIEFDPDFLDACRGYSARIPLPLPLTSDAAQNLHLCTMAWDSEKLRRGLIRNFLSLAETIGLVADTPTQLSKALDRALAQVNTHRKKHGQGPQLGIKVDPGNEHNIILKSTESDVIGGRTI